MKGLLYKDFLLSRKYYIAVSGVFLMFAGLFAMVRMSMLWGNIAADPEAVAELTGSLWILRYVPCLIITIAFAADGGAVFADYQVNWVRFCSTTAVGEYRTAAAKLLSRLIMETVGFAAGVLYVIVFCAIGNESLTWGMIGNVAICFGVGEILGMLYIAAGIWFQKKQTVELIGMAVMGLGTMIPTTILMINMDKYADDAEMMAKLFKTFMDIKDMLMPIVMIAAVVLTVLCYFAAVYGLKRRDN